MSDTSYDPLCLIPPPRDVERAIKEAEHQLSRYRKLLEISRQIEAAASNSAALNRVEEAAR